MNYDLIISGGRIVDGTGLPGYTADIGIAQGRVKRIGRIHEQADRVFDAAGLIVAPGFIDVHTHYDAQVEWDPLLTPSSWNGVTTVLAGNCGFALAPARTEDVDWLIGMLTRVEGMSRDALNAGLTFEGGSFQDYWRRFQGRLGINVGSYVGHSAVRRYVMGDDASEREATATEVDAMKELVRTAMKEGAIGFSTSQLAMHVGEDGREVPSNFASAEEVVALCSVLSEFDRGSIEIIPKTLASGYDDLDRKLIKEMYDLSGKPIELGPTGFYNQWERVAEFTREMAELGVRIYPMMSLNKVDFHIRLYDTMMFDDVPAVRDVLCLPEPDRMNALRDPAVRETWRNTFEKADYDVPITIEGLFVEAVTSDDNKPLVGRPIAEIAAERDQNIIECFIDLSLSEDLKMIFILPMAGETEKEWRRVNRELFDVPMHVVGSSDAGAHLNSFVGSDYTTRLISEWVPDTLSLENAIYRMTREPATIHGIKDRGTLQVGYKADIVCFDLAELKANPPYLTEDFPANSGRYVCDADGYKLLVVNGQVLMEQNQHTGALPGEILLGG